MIHNTHNMTSCKIVIIVIVLILVLLIVSIYTQTRKPYYGYIEYWYKGDNSDTILYILYI